MTPLMLPAAPKDVGRLSDVFVSAISSAGLGGENRLRLPKVRSTCVVLVDGLGFENLRDSSAYARYLTSKKVDSIRCEFPSTTATSITGFATGVRSGVHGVFGYSVFDREINAVRNLLTGWSSPAEASRFKRQKSLSQASETVYMIGPAAYRDSGFTELTMKDAQYVAADSIAERFETAQKLMKGPGSAVIYLYIPELDQAAHRFGSNSDQWLALLEDLDSQLRDFETSLPRDCGLIVTADHGIVDVASERHFYLDGHLWFEEAVKATTGDPRCNFLYLWPEASKEDLVENLQRAFGELAIVTTVEELVEKDWISECASDFESVLPDLFLIWVASAVGYDRRFSKPQHLKMIGQHGSISDRETRLPLIKMGAY